MTESQYTERRRKARIRRFASELLIGSYVKILAGRHKDLYGWVIKQRRDDWSEQVAVSDRPPRRGGLYQWFRVCDVWLASDEDENEPHT